MSKKLCPVCETGKQKRKCQLKQNALICTACCEAAQELSCKTCQHYSDSNRLFFCCRTCGGRDVGEDPGILAKHLQVALFPVEEFDGPMSSNGLAVSGESYRTELTFPFECQIDAPFWLLVHRAYEIPTIQLVQAVIVEILNRDIHKARVEVLARDVVSLAKIPQAFSCRELDCVPPEPSEVFPFPLSVEVSDGHTSCRSNCQDGGVWAVFTETADGPALTLFAEGWFDHWQYFGGHLRLERDFYRRLLEGGGQRSTGDIS